MRGSMFRSEEHTSELQSLTNLVCRLLLEKIDNPLNALPLHLQLMARAGQKFTSGPPNAKARSRSRKLAADTYTAEVSKKLVFFFNVPGPPKIYPFSLPAPFPI